MEEYGERDEFEVEESASGGDGWVTASSRPSAPLSSTNEEGFEEIPSISGEAAMPHVVGWRAEGRDVRCPPDATFVSWASDFKHSCKAGSPRGRPVDLLALELGCQAHTRSPCCLAKHLLRALSLAPADPLKDLTLGDGAGASRAAARLEEEDDDAIPDLADLDDSEDVGTVEAVRHAVHAVLPAVMGWLALGRDLEHGTGLAA